MPAHQTAHPIAVGIDIGGSGVKGAAVDMVAGGLVGDRVLEPTPTPSGTWTERLNAYLARLECLIAPDLIILGGGISRDHTYSPHRFLP